MIWAGNQQIKGTVTRLIRSGIINWRPGNKVFFISFNDEIFGRSIKPFTVA
jgi:hypothetical protein